MRKTKHLRLSRPQTAHAVARRAASIEQFGMNLRDWLHELRDLSTRAQLHAAVQTRPPSLALRFEQGEIADAFLAAQVELLCHQAGVRPPRWVRDDCYILDQPWFSVPGRRLRTHLLLDAPVEFRNRNLFTTPEGRFAVRCGRPRVSTATKREKARMRQQRYRLRLARKAAE